MTTPAPEEELDKRSWARKILDDSTIADPEGQYYVDKNSAESQILAYVDKREGLARIDELEKVQIRLMSVGVGENKLSKLNAERISALTNSKVEEENRE